MASILQMIAGAGPQIAGAASRGRQLGQQSQLMQLKMQQAQQQMGQQQQISDLQRTLAGALPQGPDPVQNALGQLSVYQPQQAGLMQDVQRQQMQQSVISAAEDFEAGSKLPSGEPQNALFRQAAQKVSFNPALSSHVAAIAEMPDGPEKTAAVNQALEFISSRRQAYVPAKPTMDMLERELRAKEKTAETGVMRLGIDAAAQQSRVAELALRKEEAQRKAGELKPTMQKILDDSQTRAFDSEKTANELALLARDFREKVVGGGLRVTATEFFKDALGSADEVSMLRRKFRGIRASQATKNLPPGPASDKDIQLALSGFPPENAGPEIVESFLRGAAKVARMDQAYEEFKAGYLSENKNTAGLIESWKKEKDRVLSEAIKGFGPSASRTPVMRHSTLGDITEDDIQETMRANPGMTREQILQRIGK